MRASLAFRRPSVALGRRFSINNQYHPDRTLIPKPLLTTPIFYVNASPHLGHAYSIVLADVFSRWVCQPSDSQESSVPWGRPCTLLTGTDEHGLKVQRAAALVVESPKHFCDIKSQTFRHLVSALGVTPSRFIRTTEDDHCHVVAMVWRKLVSKGWIYKGRYQGWYSVSDETYYNESQTVLRENDNARVSIDTGSVVDWISEDSYMFRLSAFQSKLLELYNVNPNFVTPQNRLNEVREFVVGGLKDLAVSRSRRSVSWGIGVPDDDHHVVYVWLDALCNYLTAAIDMPITDPPCVSMPLPLSPQLWPPALQLVGKDILRFHAVIWPALLMALDIPLPHTIAAHGWWIVDGLKMSKSKGNGIDPLDLIKVAGADAVRYFLLREGGDLSQDASFSYSQFLRRVNGDLADDLGNLVRRVTAPSLLPSRRVPCWTSSTSMAVDATCWSSIESLQLKVDNHMSNLQVGAALEKIFDVVSKLNKYIQYREPWSLRKNDNVDEAESVVRVGIYAISIVAKALTPFLPETSIKMLATVGDSIDGGLLPALPPVLFTKIKDV